MFVIYMYMNIVHVLRGSDFPCKISGSLFTQFTCFGCSYYLHYNVLLGLTMTSLKRVNKIL